MVENPTVEATPQKIKSAMQDAQVGIVITNPNLEDNPIIFVNKGFVSITQ